MIPCTLDEPLLLGERFCKCIMDPAATVHGQREFFRSGATRSFEFRHEQLRNLKAAVLTHEPALLDALHSDLRKSPREAYVTEVAIVLSEIEHALRHLRRWMNPQHRRVPFVSWPGRACVRREPFGVALIFGPWNYPVQLLLAPLAGAIAAGNCSVIKTSEQAPTVSRAIAELIQQTFAEHYITAVEGGVEVSQELLAQSFDTIFFTGSTRVGRLVMEAAARNLTPVTLELGGKCPCIVCADAPLRVAARRIAWGKFMNAGQTCVAPDFVLVDRRIRDAFVDHLRRTLIEFYGDPRQSPNYGRIVNATHLKRLTDYLIDGKVVHGGAHDPADQYLAPTILVNPPPDSPVMQDEIFGPILPVVDFDYLDDVIDLLRPRPTPLALYLFTSDHAIQERVLAETRSGGVCLNDTVLQMVNQLPFGGVGESGMGRYHGKATFDCFSHERPVLKRYFALEHSLRYPNGEMPLNRMKRLFKYALRG